MKFGNSILNSNIIDVAIHIFVTVLISLLIFFYTRNLSYLIIFIAGGIFIDLDHFIDYFFYFKRSFSLKNFFNSSYLKSGKVYLLLHSWELVFFALIFSVIFNVKALLVLALALIVHLFIDSLHRLNPFSYLLIYRIKKNFDLKVLFPEIDF
ncbi:MAG: hypothetical protein Q8N14_02980 [Candidatus Omnitrophota bacterium]|nr:hypothetical protein [Candidatus Omnitrophota bacterium]